MKNKQMQDIRPILQISVSDLTQKENTQRNYYDLRLAPGASEVILYPISAKNLLDQRFIYVRSFLMNLEYFPTSKTLNCSVFVGKLENFKSK